MSDPGAEAPARGRYTEERAWTTGETSDRCAQYEPAHMMPDPIRQGSREDSAHAFLRRRFPKTTHMLALRKPTVARRAAR